MYSKTYTLGNFRDRILQLLDRYSSNGTIVVSGERADIENRLVTSLNIHLTRLMYEFPDNRRKVLLSMLAPECAGIIGRISLCEEKESVHNFTGSGLAYYMEARGKGRLIINCDGRSIVREIYTDNGAFTVIRGTVGNSVKSECSFVLSCDSYLDVRGFTVYSGVPQEMTDDELICPSGFGAAYLPDDCAQILSVYSGAGTELDESDYCVLEKERMIIADAKRGHDIGIEYIPYAPQFSEEEGDASAVEISPIMADALGYMCAADLCPVNQPELYSRLTYKYREILGNTYSRHRKNGMINKFYGLIKRRYRTRLGGGVCNVT